MWEQYTKRSQIENNASEHDIRRKPEEVHAFLKNLESGLDHPDSKTITEVAIGALKSDDEKMRNYLIKQYQKKKY